ncbi:copper-transporting ATPase PAA1, chloroplastic-like [Vicia villosa]|uniref:copper-transporting ATPase PAA1, chloroplastic-like n=1 Tax=Vicia villosa TaxID=3911 RepID=UPI00273B9C41|nr:copper-transporting ATPase PAA1, chloroplastic-like [Vicia villosa]XP_058771743.1 copper-transporting ATPase PAA1, chloroplastic-like [Vicia villosa]
MSSSSSSILVIQIPTATTVSAVKQISLFKPLNLNFQKGRSIQRQLNHHAPCHNSVKPLRLRCSASSSGGDHLHEDDAIVLHVRGMMCEGCASSVKKILETQPQVLSATVNLASETALVSPLLSEDKTPPNWQKQLGETLANHLTTCGFATTLRGQEDSR